MYYQELENENESPLGYFGISTVVHVAAAVLSVFISISMPEKPPMQVIEIEVLPPRGVQTQALSAPAPAPSPEPVIQKQVTVRQQARSSAPRVAKAAAPLAKAKAAKSGSGEAAFVPKFEIANKELLSIPDDEPLPEVPVFNEKEDAFVANELSENAITDSIGMAEQQDQDTSGEKLIGAIGADVDQQTNNSLSAIDGELNSLKQQTGIATSNIKRRGALQRAALVGNGPGGSGTAKRKFGTPTGVRKIEDLRILNRPKPAYTIEDRVKRRSGVAIFVVYINNKGFPEKINVAQSTGFESLDQRSLAAVKKYRFYAGQEGWVEIPFNWQLQGGTTTAQADE